MPEHIIKIPQNFDFYNFDDLTVSLEKINAGIDLNEKNTIIFEISETKYLSVIGVLIIVQTADSFFKKNCECVVRCLQSNESSSWFKLESLGVFKKVDKEYQEFFDSFTVPIQRIFDYGDFDNAINKKIMPLIKTNFNPPDSVLKAINWTLIETVDNAMCHGYSFQQNQGRLSEPVYACAYLYKNCLDVGILDIGQGIRNSFLNSGNPKYQGIDDEKALELAIQRGESGRKGGGTGLGLWGCSEIAKQSDGDLVILSGNKWLHLRGQDHDIRTCLNFNGTIVQLSIPRNVGMDFYKVFDGKIDITPNDFGWLTGNVS